MRAALHRLSFAALALIASAAVAAAAEVRVLTVGSTQHAAQAIAADFSKMTGHTVSFTVTAPFLIDKELASKPFDAIIVAVPPMEALDKAGQLRPGSRAAISRVGVGLVVREGAPVPDISTPEAFKRTMLAARSTRGNVRRFHFSHYGAVKRAVGRSGEMAVSNRPIMLFPTIGTAHPNSDHLNMRQAGSIGFNTAFDRSTRPRAREYQSSHIGS